MCWVERWVAVRGRGDWKGLEGLGTKTKGKKGGAMGQARLDIRGYQIVISDNDKDNDDRRRCRNTIRPVLHDGTSIYLLCSLGKDILADRHHEGGPSTVLGKTVVTITEDRPVVRDRSNVGIILRGGYRSIITRLHGEQTTLHG